MALEVRCRLLVLPLGVEEVGYVVEGADRNPVLRTECPEAPLLSGTVRRVLACHRREAVMTSCFDIGGKAVNADKSKKRSVAV